MPLTQGMVDELVRRARAQGATERFPNATADEPETDDADAVATALADAMVGAFEGLDAGRVRAVLAATLREELPALAI